MSVDRIQRINELLRREIGLSLYRLMGVDSGDMASVTITRVEAARNLRKARVHVSIREDSPGSKMVMKHIERHRAALQSHLNTVLKLKFTPRLEFYRDRSIAEGDRVLGILAGLENDPPVDT